MNLRPAFTRRVYIASRLENAEMVREVGDVLRKHGWTITYDWTVHGSVRGHGIEVIQEVADKEFQGVVSADVVLALLPGGRGTHTEIGIGLGSGIPVVLASDDAELVGDSKSTCAFYHHPGVVAATALRTEQILITLEGLAHQHGARAAEPSEAETEGSAA